MVGLVIGLITSLIVFQVFEVTERQRRTTTGGADAQTSGAFALYMLERDIRMAGFGLDREEIDQCTTWHSYYAGQKTPGPIEGLPIEGLDASAPVLIEDGGAGPDQIDIVYYSNPADSAAIFPANTRIIRSTPGSFWVDANIPCNAGEQSIIIQGNQCTLIGVTKVGKEAGEKRIYHQSSGNDSDARFYNPSDTSVYPVGATVRCGLKTPFVRRFHLQDESLAYRDNDVSINFAPNIVDLQAQYGVAQSETATDISDWVDATQSWAKTTLTSKDGKRIRAVRVAVVARSSEYEKPRPNTACNTTTAAMVDAWSDWADFSHVKTLADWQCYRYKVFETVIPLRNAIWAAQ